VLRTGEFVGSDSASKPDVDPALQGSHVGITFRYPPVSTLLLLNSPVNQQLWLQYFQMFNVMFSSSTLEFRRRIYPI
jgi:hypothetical protein